MLGLNTMTFLINSCVYAGGEIGSTDGEQRSGELWIDHLMVTIVTANDNFAFEEYALAAQVLTGYEFHLVTKRAHFKNYQWGNSNLS